MVQTFAVFVDDPTTVKIKTECLNGQDHDVMCGCGVHVAYIYAHVHAGNSCIALLNRDSK